MNPKKTPEFNFAFKFRLFFTRFLLRKKNTKVLLTAHVRGLRMTRKNAFNFRHVWLHFLSSGQPSMLYSSVHGRHC
jgi:hypothetical protein